MEDIINKGLEKGLISFNEDKSRITYTYVNKTRNYLDPEEKIEAESFLKLVLVYNYPVQRVK